MSEPDQCIICLDHLPRPAALNGTTPDLKVPPTAVDDTTTLTSASVDDDLSYLNIVAALDGCEHVIHDACIRSWAQKTNTCPICRKPFHSIRVYNGADGECCLLFSTPLAECYRTQRKTPLLTIPNHRYRHLHLRCPRQEADPRIRFPAVAGRQSRRRTRTARQPMPNLQLSRAGGHPPPLRWVRCRVPHELHRSRLHPRR